MTQDLNRLARAVAATRKPPLSIAPHLPTIADEDAVRAVLIAMRDEPSEGAVEAGAAVGFFDPPIFRFCFVAAINHILTEGGR